MTLAHPHAPAKLPARQARRVEPTPLFARTHDALMFAYHYNSAQYAESMLAKVMRQGGGCCTGKGLIGHDGAAQVGMIQAEISRLPPTQQDCLAARFALRMEACTCCGGERPAAVWRQAIDALTAQVLPTGVSQRQARRDLIAKYFGMPGLEFKSIAERHGLNRKTLSDQYQILASRLQALEDEAQSRIEAVLRSKGMVA